MILRATPLLQRPKRLAKEVWLAMARDPQALSMGDIPALWEGARAQERWGTASGLGAVARLEVQRMGMDVGPR